MGSAPYYRPHAPIFYVETDTRTRLQKARDRLRWLYRDARDWLRDPWLPLWPTLVVGCIVSGALGWLTHYLFG